MPLHAANAETVANRLFVKPTSITFYKRISDREPNRSHLNRAEPVFLGYFQGGGVPQRPHDVVALVGSRLVGPKLPRG